MTYSSEVLADTPIAYYRLGEASGTTCADSSGNARDMAYAASPTLGVTGALSGDSDTAVTLNGSTQYAQIASASWMNGMTALTVEAWVKTTTTSTGARVVARAAAPSNYDIGVGNGKAFISINTNSGGSQAVVGATTINDGAWHHIAGVWTGSTLIIYVDGVSDGTLSKAGTLASVTAALRIGQRNSDLWYAGTVDEVALYGTALSSTRIAAHYSAGTSVAVTGTLATTLADTALAATGGETFSGTFTATLDDTMSAAAGAETFTGTLAATLADTTLTASGAETFSGALATTLDDTTLVASGTVGSSVIGDLATTLDDTQFAATGGETFAGTLSTTLDDSTLSAVGAVAVPVAGTLAGTLADTALVATGTSLTILPTPTSRTYVIRRETRTSSIPAETRTRTILAEHRTLSIPAEPRTRTIPAETRTLEVTT